MKTETYDNPTQQLGTTDPDQYTFQNAVSLFGSGWEEINFELDGDDGGQKVTTGISVQIKADLFAGATLTDTVSDEFAVTVNDQGAEFGNATGDTDGDGNAGGVSGSAGTGGSGDDDEEDDTD